MLQTTHTSFLPIGRKLYDTNPKANVGLVRVSQAAVRTTISQPTMNAILFSAESTIRTAPVRLPQQVGSRPAGCSGSWSG